VTHSRNGNKPFVRMEFGGEGGADFLTKAQPLLVSQRRLLFSLSIIIFEC
jgi:hypothetical protein